MFIFNNYFYFLTVVLQAVCVIHCIRKGSPGNWIWIIILLPVIGSLAYIFIEIFTARDINKVQSGVGNLFNPGSNVRKLEKELRFSDTFNNRVALADAYFQSGQMEKAISLYESSLTGNFVENEYVPEQLILAYFQVKRYDAVIPLAQKIYKRPQFARSRQHIFYAMSLNKTGNTERAEIEFRLMKTRFSNYEARFEYACFMLEHQRVGEAKALLAEIVGEFSHLSPRERRYNRNWLAKAKEEVRKLP